MAACPNASASTAYLLVDVLQQGLPKLPGPLRLRLLSVLVLQGVRVSEVRLGVDVVEAGPGDYQLPVQQLHILEEGQTLSSLPPRDLLSLYPSPWSFKKNKNNNK